MLPPTRQQAAADLANDTINHNDLPINPPPDQDTETLQQSFSTTKDSLISIDMNPIESPTTMPRTLFLMCKASNNKATKSMSVETLMKQLENDQRASPDFAPNVV